MSRFVEILAEHRGEISTGTLPSILASLRQKLHAESTRLDITFPFFIEKAAPVSGAKAMMDYECGFTAEANGSDNLTVRVRVPVTSLCPCSKEISDYGAHNQRCYVTIEARVEAREEPDPLSLEQLIDIAESCSSAPLYPLLKRPDERHVTMLAYDHPALVEDIARDVALQLKSDGRVIAFRVHVRSDESIHNHCAFAELSWRR
jgi:GTP cyclohydrolase I